MPAKKSVRMPAVRGAMGLALAAGLWTAGVSCGKFVRQAPPAAGPRGELLKDNELPVLMTRLGQYPKRFVTGADKVAVRFYFDPQLVDLTKVTGYSLWQIDGPTKTWKRIGAASPAALPLEIQPAEGLHGLRASVTYEGGVEKLIPRPTDEPAVWLAVDRSPPAITWIAPAPDTSVRGVRSLELKWSTSELQLGESIAELEWSSDRGRAWKPIARVPLEYGQQSFTWRLPPEVASDLLVRLRARDLAGHDAAAVLALAYPGSVTSGQPAIAMDSPAPGAAAAGPAPVASLEPEPEPDAGAASDTASHGTVATAPPPPAAGGAPPAPAAPPPGASPPSPVAGSDPPRVDPGLLKIVDAPEGLRPAGSPAVARWQCAEPAPGAEVVVETSIDGGATWVAAGKAPAAQGKLEWALPSTTVAGGRVRLALQAPGAERTIAGAAETFSIDADPPRIAITDMPEVAGPRVEAAIELADAGGSDVDRIHAHVRPVGQKDWRELDPARVSLAGKRATIGLDELGEEDHELWLRAVDRAGNSSPQPPEQPLAPGSGSASAAGGKIRIDRTPPSLDARPSPLEWVGGFATEMLVDADWTDGIPPLYLEGRDASGAWKELGRWASVSPDQNRFSFVVPAGVESYSIRFVVADVAGNKAESVVGPQSVVSPIRLEGFADGKALPARSSEKVVWRLHPVAAEVADELTVQVAHQPRAGGDWRALYDDLPARGECYWDLPAADGEQHRLRVRLLRQGRLVGEAQSAPFAIEAAGAGAPTVVRINEDSLFYSEQARAQADKVFAAGDSGAVGAAEMERLRAAVIAGYEKALDADARNHKAAYGLAQFLNRVDGDKSAAAVTRWLERTVEIKPDHFWAWNDLGAAYIRDGKYPRATGALERALAIEAKPIVLFNLGLALFFGGQHSRARERFQSALQSSRGEVPEGEIYYYVVQTYLLEGNVAEAKGIFNAKEGTMPEDMRAEAARAIRG